MKTLKKTASLLTVTALTALTIFAAVAAVGGGTTAPGGDQQGQLVASSRGVSSPQSAASAPVMACPRTGCTSTYCHKTGQGVPPGTAAGSQQGAGAQQQAAQGAGQGVPTFIFAEDD